MSIEIEVLKLDPMTNWKEASKRASVYVDAINLDTLKQSIIDANDTAALNNIEAMHNNIVAELAYEAGIDERVRRIHLGIRIIATINKLNDDNNITAPQLTNILLDNDIQAMIGALQTGSLNMAKALINAKDVSSLAPMSNTYKTTVNKMIEDYFAN